MPDIDEKKPTTGDGEDGYSDEIDIINASGHVQELDRSFGLWSICSVAIVADDAWGAGGGALVVALYNGGGPGVLYGLIAATFFYIFIGASLAELASGIPSSANVYHWASVAAGPRYGRMTSFFAGWLNAFAWIFGVASSCAFGANACVALYSLYHPDYTPQRWQLFLAFIGILWLDAALLLFGQRILARASTTLGALCITFWLVTVLTCAIMPSMNGSGYASNAFVWSDFSNLTGWDSNGLVFVMGMLNGAFTIGTPDSVTHLCEEIPNPRVNIPKGILAQLTSGFITSFVFYIAILYGTTSLDDVFNTNIVSLPLAAMYQQATGSTAATAALLVLFLFNIIVTIPGAYITAGRMMFTLARDNAVPFSSVFRRVHPTWRNPFNAQLLCGALVTVLGLIYIGSATAFNAFVGSFAILTTLSYLLAILPHLLSRRQYFPAGPFYMPTAVAYPVLGIASAYIIVWNVIYLFPFTYPTTADTMNYSSVMCGGLTILLFGWYLYKRSNGYTGPQVALHARDDILKGRVGLTMAEEEALRHQSAAH